MYRTYIYSGRYRTNKWNRPVINNDLALMFVINYGKIDNTNYKRSYDLFKFYI